MAALHRLAYRLAFAVLRVWWWLRRPRMQSAAVAIWCGERLLLLRTSYRDGWSFPAGGLARGETALEGALRETCEEVGAAFQPSQLVPGAILRLRHEYRHDTIHVFEVCLAAPVMPRIDHREVVEAGFFGPQEYAKLRLLPAVALYLRQKSQGPGAPASPGHRSESDASESDPSAPLPASER